MNLRKEAKRAASLICESSCPTESQIDFMETVLREIHNEAIEAASQVVYRHSGNCDEFYEIRKLKAAPRIDVTTDYRPIPLLRDYT